MNAVAITALAISTSVVIASLVRGHFIDSVKVGTRFVIPYRVPLDKHLCILGPTRAGKTSLIRAMIKELSRKYVVTVLDWHGEYVGILPTLPTSAIRIELDRLPPKLLTEILGFGLGLNEPSMYMLYRIIRDGNYTDFNDLISKIDNYLVSTRTEAEMKAAILRRLEYAASNIGNGIVSIEKLMEGDAVIDLSDLTIIEEKKLVSSLILASMYMYYMRRGLIERRVNHVLIIEEAQNLLSNEGPSYSIVDHIIMELAKYGLRAVLISNAIPKSSLLKHCNVILFKVNPEFLNDEVSLSRELISKLNEITSDEALVITNKGVTRIRPLKAVLSPNHIIIRRIYTRPRERRTPGDDIKTEAAINNGDGANRTESSIANVNYKNNGNANIQSRTQNFANSNNGNVVKGNDVFISDNDSPFKRQILELEREVINLKDMVNEIERILEADEKMIERILEIDSKLKTTKSTS